jgi:hypothetical protein
MGLIGKFQICLARSLFPWALAPSAVLNASQSSGGRAAPNDRLQATLKAINTTAVRDGQTVTAPVIAKQTKTRIPHQVVPGKRMPRLLMEMPTRQSPSGGKTVSRMPTGARQIASLGRGDQTTSQGTLAGRELPIQRPAATRADTSGPKKFLAPGTSAHRAAV